MAIKIHPAGTAIGSLPPSGTYAVWDLLNYLSATVIDRGINYYNTPSGDALDAAKAEIDRLFLATARGLNEDVTRKASFLACTTDPIAQNFFVSEASYPDGVFLVGMGLYFKSKDDNLPVTVEVRPTVNGYPSSSQIVPLTTVVKNHWEVSVSDDGTAVTYFEFPAPVYFSPNEYSIVVRSNSSKYFCFISEVGKVQIGTNKIISTQPYVGSFFISQNASTWTPKQEMDLSFTLYKAKFNTANTFFNTFVVDIPAEHNSFNYSTYKVTSQEIDFDEKTDINYEIKTALDGSVDADFKQIVANKNLNLSTERNINTTGNTSIRVSMSTKSQDISPVIDLDRLSIITVKNIINSESDLVIDEALPGGGNAFARYVTRRVTLADGFDATGLRVILDINRPVGTSIKVYYKIKSADDSTDMDLLGYQEMTMVPKAQNFTVNEDDYLIDEYTAYNVNYTNNGVLYNTFKVFAIKIVMFSTNPAVVPVVKNLRAIAVS